MDNITKLFSEETFQEAEKRNQKSIDNENIKHKALTSLVGRVEGSLGDLHSKNNTNSRVFGNNPSRRALFDS